MYGVHCASAGQLILRSALKRGSWFRFVGLSPCVVLQYERTLSVPNSNEEPPQDGWDFDKLNGFEPGVHDDDL